MTHGLSCSTACGNLSDQGLNPCLWHWQADSLPLSHQEAWRIGEYLQHTWTSGLSFLIPLARSFSQPLFSQGSRSPLGSERNVWKTWLIVAQCTFKMLVLQAKEYLAQSGPNEEGNLLAHDWKLHGRICFRQAASQQLCHSLPFSLSVFFFFFLFLLTALAICCGTLVFSSCGTQNVLLAEHRF